MYCFWHFLWKYCLLSDECTYCHLVLEYFIVGCLSSLFSSWFVSLVWLSEKLVLWSFVEPPSKSWTRLSDPCTMLSVSSPRLWRRPRLFMVEVLYLPLFMSCAQPVVASSISWLVSEISLNKSEEHGCWKVEWANVGLCCVGSYAAQPIILAEPQGNESKHQPCLAKFNSVA